MTTKTKKKALTKVELERELKDLQNLHNAMIDEKSERLLALRKEFEEYCKEVSKVLASQQKEIENLKEERKYLRMCVRILDRKSIDE